MPSSNVSIFEEISEQNLDDFSAGDAAVDNWRVTLAQSLVSCAVSRGLSNGGGVCTLTLECQNNCN